MRISLLLEREPFPQILEKTLSQFWSYHFEQDIRVRWQDGRPRRQQPGQTWLVNAYLNAIFVPDVARELFDPIRREFSRSPVWWKRPLQQTYVQLATQPRLAQRFTQAHLVVSPALPQAAQTLIIPGNHKIRWLDATRQTATGMLKAGFDDHFLRQEIGARQQATAVGVRVPALHEADADAGWFVEQFVSATPVNRLADGQQAARAVGEAAAMMQRLLRATAETMPVAVYCAELREQILRLVEGHHLLTTGEKETVAAQTSALCAMAQAKSETVVTALTHGDWQPANILLNADGVWVIDWEYAARRQVGYDALVWGLNGRFPQGLAARLWGYIEQGRLDGPADVWAQWPEMLNGRAGRMVQIALFLLEELALTLAEVAQPLLKNRGDGWGGKQTAVAEWLESVDSGHVELNDG